MGIKNVLVLCLVNLRFRKLVFSLSFDWGNRMKHVDFEFLEAVSIQSVGFLYVGLSL